ncbi:hypothetical protein DNHGIG_22670 [Collibacillus ludicampi]|uniref:DUF1292 domain-containing protein n=1 Tax=Collibacillus ludicampi TaxID=2771369 RepID=A0AAV4LG16_9BACL|nr:DUF1292 domain-containing protein [Collibacillus ludicampi]GIM46718.1 hypothetical protein DNHGIG_22670 [Collibacillus ludicampi]
MKEHEERDYITIEDEEGKEKAYAVEALFDMDDRSYVLLSSEHETLLMRVEGNGGDQYLVGITDPVERESILNAYEIAVDAAPAD